MGDVGCKIVLMNTAEVDSSLGNFCLEKFTISQNDLDRDYANAVRHS